LDGQPVSIDAADPSEWFGVTAAVCVCAAHRIDHR